MNENTITTKLIKVLNTIPNCYARKQHGGMFSSGDPDINACIDGHSLKIEVKVSGGELSALQAEQMEKWSGANSIVMLAIWDYADKSFTVYSSAQDWRQLVGKCKNIPNLRKACVVHTSVPCDAKSFSNIL